ncbi:MAG: allophanate hydrolase [Rhodospirillaceae bacterium]|nr:allophanate hydrolase [Rhodospirillaceae bacterium]|tara:strand:- start:531 stop:1265 length:735 start_codon:yes stop_codon:yes gene_type:complete
MGRKIKTDNPRFLAAGDTALVIQFGEEVDVLINQKVRQLGVAVGTEAIAGIVDIVPTMRSLMIHYNPLIISQIRLIEKVKPLLELQGLLNQNKKHWKIPVCYEGKFAPDMDYISKSLDLSVDEIVRQHTSDELEVFMMGFLPGFPYLGLLPKIFDLPRRIEPRVHVPPRSISVAARQTTIYTINSPGGWHLIGQTPVDFYDPQRTNPILVSAGDRVRFFSIKSEDFANIRESIRVGEFNLEEQN